MTEQPIDRQSCGWCLVHDHAHCRPTTTQPGWICGCHERGHR
jgi:hypothetical protein